MNATQQAIAAIKAALGADDIAGALKTLNQQTPYRFTALFRFEDPTLRNAYLIDRENPGSPPLPDLPITASYCVYIRQTARQFVTPDSWADERVRDHPKRQEIRTYCGVPVLNDDGSLFGSLCHFDFEVKPVADADIDLLERAADLLREGKRG
ncbi:MAG TPA: GAF domain-containing protein [Herpetosiphonaceae bacterium]